MSFRSQPTEETRMRDQLRYLFDAVTKLQRGGAVAGRVSLGPRFRIGGGGLDVDVEVVDLGGGAKQIVFTNVATGATATISL